MKRRRFITLLGAAAAAWPLAARAQQSAMPVVGYLSARSAPTDVPMLAALNQGLAEIGFIEGQNVVIERRWGEGQYHRLPAHAADLVRQQVAVIVTAGGETVAQIAKQTTSTIPIVFLGSGDPFARQLGLSFRVHPVLFVRNIDGAWNMPATDRSNIFTSKFLRRTRQ